MSAVPIDSNAIAHRPSPLPQLPRQWWRFKLGWPWALRAVSLLAFILFWHVVTTHKLSFGLVTFVYVPSPAEVIQAAVRFVQSPRFGGHLGNSVFRVFAGFLAATIAGIALGLVIGRSAAARHFVLPPLEVLRPIPGVAWIPLSILMFPSSEVSMIFITFMGALFPILLNTIHGAEGVDPRLIATARGLGAGPWALVRDTVIPGALPSIFTGLTLGMGTSWFCLVTAEMIAGQYGTGYYTWESYTLQNYADIVVGMVLIGLLGMLSSAAIHSVGRSLMPWYRQEART